MSFLNFHDRNKELIVEHDVVHCQKQREERERRERNGGEREERVRGGERERERERTNCGLHFCT